MGLLAQLFQPRYQAYSPTSDFWYNPVGAPTLTGVNVSSDSAMKISAVWACVGAIAESLSSIPLPIYERLPEGRQPAVNYYLYDVIHDQPNKNQTTVEWRSLMTTHALLRGNGYSEIVPGRRGAVDQLIPLNPDAVTPEQQWNGKWYDDLAVGAGPIRYKVRQQDGTDKILSDDQVFHLRGMGNGKLKALSVIQYARESFGLAMATEQYGARWFSQDARPRGVLKHPGKLSSDSKLRLKEGWEAMHSGLANAHRIAVLEEGMEFQPISIAPEDSQFLQTRDFQVSDIARWFRVPLHMIQAMTKETAWGTGIESLSLAFVIYTLQPWAVRWEQAIRRDLISETRRYYAKHTFAGLLRGDQKSRYEAYAQARNWGWLSVNDIRELEEMNPVDDGDIYLEPGNMRPAGTYTEPESPAPAPRPSGGNAHYDLLLHEAAGRIVRKEIAALSKLAKRCSGDTEAWREAVEGFYAEHLDFVVQSLRIGRDKAAAYTAEQRAILLQQGVGALETWETARAACLVRLAKGE